MADPSLVQKFFPQERNEAHAGETAVVGGAEGGMQHVGLGPRSHASAVSAKNTSLEKRQECADSRDTESGNAFYHCVDPSRLIHEENSLKLCLCWLRLSSSCLTPQQPGTPTQD